MNLNKTNYGYIRKDSSTKEVLIAKGIEQAWRRRFSYNIHSGVRVKIQRKNSLFIEPIHSKSKSVLSNPTNHIQSMLKRLWIESEASALSQNGQKSLEKSDNPSKKDLLTSYQTKPILNNSFLGKNHSLRSYPKDKHVNSIGIQTTIIPKLDQQTSCDIVIPTSKHIKSSYRNSSSSSSSVSETSISDENSTHTDDTSPETSEVSNSISGKTENRDYNTRYQRNKNRNNNSLDNDIEQKNNFIKMEEIKTQLSNNKQPSQDMNTNSQCYSQSALSPVPSARKKRFFSTLLNLFPFLRFSSFKRDQVSTIETPIIIGVDRKAENKILPSSTSRCRRSAANRIQSEKNPSSKLNHLDQKASIHSFSDTSMLTGKSYRQTNNSSLPVVDSPSNLRKARSHRRSNRHHKRKYLHRKKQKHIRSSLKTSSPPSIAIDIQPLSSIDDQSNNLKSSVSLQCVDNLSSEIVPCTTNTSMFKCNILPSSFHTKRNAYKQNSPLPTDSIHLCVKNKNLISILSKSEIPLSSIYHVDDSIHSHQMNIINEFKSLLQQTKHFHSNNNNALDDEPTVDTCSPLRTDINESRSNPMKNQNENKRVSILSSDSQSISTEQNPISIHQMIQGQNGIIREGIEQLIRYQKFAKHYELKSNKAIKQFLMKSTALSSESLYKLSINNEPHSSYKAD